MSKLLLFDGECNFCDNSVQFIIKRDPGAIYKFAALQSDAGLEVLKTYQIPLHIDSFLLIDGKKYFTKSSAALRVCKNLTGLWKLLYIFILVPKPLRDFAYSIVAKNRYKWFGKKDNCMIPTSDIRDRFL
ncbi:thiol-disulfide oxidoreductase DCC family protein [Virgibacillus flavescens]|uniref:thiol-disulfide oxidoreductase DCC family protein n=1 Tax=Virgibacillus flavescens TaxID=1611422 RepID=UPI003D345FE9